MSDIEEQTPQDPQEPVVSQVPQEPVAPQVPQEELVVPQDPVAPQVPQEEPVVPQEPVAPQSPQEESVVPQETSTLQDPQDSDGSNQISPDAVEKIAPSMDLALENPPEEKESKKSSSPPSPPSPPTMMEKLLGKKGGAEASKDPNAPPADKKKQIIMFAAALAVAASVGGYLYLSAVEDSSWTPPPREARNKARAKSAVARAPRAARSSRRTHTKQAVVPVTAGQNTAMPNAKQLKPVVSLADQIRAGKIKPLPKQGTMKEANAKAAQIATEPTSVIVAKPEVTNVAVDKGVSSVEQAIVDNSAVLSTIPAPAEAKGTKAVKEAKKSTEVKTVEVKSVAAEPVKDGVKGKRIIEILAKKANIRPIPDRYVVVKKESHAESFDSRLTGARSALAQARYASSLELFSDLYERYPEDVRVLMGWAVSLQKLGRNTEALNTYEEVLNVDPKNIEALTNMLGILGAQEKDIALKHLLQLKDMHPYNPDIMAQLGMIYGVMGDYRNSIKYLNMADSLKPNDINTIFNKAVAYDKMGDGDKAMELYRKLVYMTSYGDHSEINIPIAQIKKRLGAVR